MTDIELRGLIAIVELQTALTNGDIARFGQPMCDPNTPQLVALRDELELRGLYVTPKYDDQGVRIN